MGGSDAPGAFIEVLLNRQAGEKKKVNHGAFIAHAAGNVRGFRARYRRSLKHHRCLCVRMKTSPLEMAIDAFVVSFSSLVARC